MRHLHYIACMLVTMAIMIMSYGQCRGVTKPYNVMFTCIIDDTILIAYGTTDPCNNAIVVWQSRLVLLYSFILYTCINNETCIKTVSLNHVNFNCFVFLYV